jgi:acyl-homoserine lactone acylase PvdQ
MSVFPGAQAAQMAAEMAEAITKEALKAFSLGLGAYLSTATSIYLAFKGTIKFLATRA